MPAILGTDIEAAAEWLRRGDVIGMPTETVYGLAGNAFDTAAVARIFAVKQRPHFDPLIVHTHSPDALLDIASALPPAAQRLADAFMPGPLTLLLPRRAEVPDLVTSGLPTVALRVPRHPLAQALLRLLDFPLAAPSANPFGYISPTTAAHVAKQLGALVPYILDGGPCQVGVESSIVGFDEQGRAVIYRKGGIAVEAIERVVGPVKVLAHSSSQPSAPGMLKSHYAPRVPLRLGDAHELLARHAGLRVGLLSYRTHFAEVREDWQVCLAPSGDYAEAAARLFAALRYLDEQDLDLIVAELLPEEDLGRAINDRLRRAAADK